MIVKALSVQSPIQPQNHRSLLAFKRSARGLRWFWRFSQFYGEYTVRSPQERQRWLKDRWLSE